MKNKIINIKKFPVDIIRVVFLQSFKEKDVGVYRLLSSFLLETSDSGLSGIVKEFKRLYGANMMININYSKNKLITSFILEFIDQKYVEDENYFQNVINLFIDHLFNASKYFTEKNFEQIKKSFISKQKYALNRPSMIAANNLNKCIHLPKKNYFKEKNLKDLELLELEEFKNTYLNLVSSPYKMYFFGRLDSKKKEIINKTFNSSLKVKKTQIKRIKNQDFQEKIVTKKIKQTVMKLGYLQKDENQSKHFYVVSFLADMMLGGSGSSILFKEIREKSSFCYSISSDYSFDIGLQRINVELSKDNIDACKKKIIEIVDNIDNYIDKDFFELHKGLYLSLLDENADYARSHMQFLLEKDFSIYPKDFDEYKMLIQEITLDEVLAFIKGLSLITAVIVKGVL